MLATEEIFALDIGTRSVVGLIGVHEATCFKIIDSEIMEHNTRAMLDGQIHDIAAVSQVVRRVKERLEERQGRKLTDVAVAAAGRALKTLRGTAVWETFSLEEISKPQVLELELAAVQQAQTLLAVKDSDSQYYQCVGYSVVGYQLDGSPMTNLVSHRGSQIAAEVIATFLPRSVVDSLYSVLKNSGLNMRTLTLEPIAALNVAIPAGMRNLNLALVDIGAGTSDIALVRDGTIQNYAMVPMAGDEITEYLAKQYLLDFGTAEQLKRTLHRPGLLRFQDVLGFTQEVDAAEVLQYLTPGVESLAKAIGNKINELNCGSPAAVVLVGGGSLTPGLAKSLAAVLKLPEQRVALRGTDVIPGLEGELAKLRGPECITPIGIAITSVTEQALNLLHVEVNHRPVRLFSINNGTVADALLAAGFSLHKLHGKPGMALTVTVNGELKIIKGELGISAVIRCNGETVDLNHPLHSGDCLEVTPARDGMDAKGTIDDVLPNIKQFVVRINGQETSVMPRITMNGSLVSPQTALVDRAQILCQEINTVGDLLDYLEIEPPTYREMQIMVNGIPRNLGYTLGAILLNGKAAGIDSLVHEHDDLEFLDQVNPVWRVRDVAPHSGPTFIDIILNGRPRSFPGPRTQLKLNGQEAFGAEPLSDGDNLEYVTAQQELIFSDLFKYLDFQPSPPPGKSKLKMEVNGQSAQFTSVIHPGDSVTLEWA